MPRALLLLLSLSLVTAIFLGAMVTLHSSVMGNPPHNLDFLEACPGNAMPRPDFCFAPGTSPEYMAEVQRRTWGDHYLDYFLGSRWTHTANNANTGAEGQPITLTYSFVPDGVSIHDQWSIGANVLFSRMNSLFGSPSVWQAKFAGVFAEWGQLTGVHYVQVTDDGAAFPSSNGQLGARGDIRITCKRMDGPSNVLAQTWFPNQGDMEFDSSEDWSAPAQNFIFLRNVAAHEHGHGLGLEHVCPIDETKLLEPYYTSAFDGPQHDDIRAAQRNYGDRFEPNNTVAMATSLGTLSIDTSLANLSLDHTSDIDYFTFTIPAGKGFTLSLQPVGWSYLNGQQNDDGTCSDGTPFNSLTLQNLDLYLYNAAGTTLLAQSSAHPSGVAETIFHYPVSSSGGSFVAKVVGQGTDDCQIYELDFALYYLDDPYLTLSSVDFDSIAINTARTLTTRIINHSASVRHVTALNTADPFSVSPSAPLTIQPYDSATLSLTYTAGTLGTQIGALTIAHDGPTGALQCSLSGTTTGAWLHWVASQTVSFGNVPVGSVDSVRVPIRAQGNVPLVITSFDAPAPFGILMSLPLVVAPNSSAFLNPRFAPTALGPAQGMIVFHHNGITSTDTMFVGGTATPAAAGELPDPLPTVFSLAQNYPNPFNPTTTIAFDLPHAAAVRLEVYDIEGRLVQELVNSAMEAGHHSVSFDGSTLTSGIYFYRLTSPEFTAMSKMALVK